MIKKILIANRGEIACRVIRSCQRLGITTVAVYSSADANALHVQMADEAYYIGLAPAVESYLDVDKVIEVCKAAKVDAVHPGYGFLSENTAFAKRLEKENIIFIGPKAKSIDAMGDKAKAKAIMEKAGVPLVPGYHGKDQSLKHLQSAADKMGYPVLIKAVAGGGGKGMRIVRNTKEFKEALEGAQREAKSSFKDDAVLVEKYLENPRHVEVQVFGDTKGNIVHLFERDCSVQRRHQKIIEEAPAFGLTDTQRQAIGKTAVEAARAVDYVGAGTVEFLLDTDGSFYFMEMNTRLQVEHPITEMITGQDLVEWQIHVANGKPLPLKQSEIKHKGHAFEVRLYAESPSENFIPQAGTITHLVAPTLARFDSGLREVNGWSENAKTERVSIYYDPMIAKIIVHDTNRKGALEKMRHALAETEILGIKTNLEFLRNCFMQPDFIKEKISTKFVETHLETLLKNQRQVPQKMAQIFATLFLFTQEKDKINTYARREKNPLLKRLQTSDAERSYVLDAQKSSIRQHGNHYHVIVAGKEYVCHLKVYNNNKFSVLLQDVEYEFRAIQQRTTITLFTNGTSQSVEWDNPLLRLSDHKDDKKGELKSPMPAKVIKVLVKKGQTITAGDKLIILEAMKMEHSIVASKDGKVKSILVKEGEQVDGGIELIELQA